MGQEAQWTQDFEISGGNLSKAGDVSMQIKKMLKQLGFPPEIVRRAAIACYEAEMNVVMYANRGTLQLSVSPRRLEISIEDEGEGIEDIELAMQEGFSTADEQIRELGFGAGMGLPNIKKNSDEMQLTSVKNEGTKLWFAINIKEQSE